MAFSQTGSLLCSFSSNRRQLNNNQQIEDNSDDEDNPLQLAKATDGKYYLLGSRGPCGIMTSLSATNRCELLFGYDVFKLKPVCVDVSQFDSPYFNPTKEHQRFDLAFNRSTVFMTRVSTKLRHQVQEIHSFSKDIGRSNGKRRQGALTSGLFQVPGSLPDPLLNPCRPGAKKDKNYKCTNPHV